MSDNPSRQSSLKAPSIGLAVCVGGLLLSAGLCGVGYGNASANQTTAEIGVGVFIVSMLSLVVCVLWLIVAAIARASGK